MDNHSLLLSHRAPTTQPGLVAIVCGRHPAQSGIVRKSAKQASRLILLLLLFCWLCKVGGEALAQSQASVHLAWDPSPTVSLTGYSVYYGLASHLYTSKMHVGDVTSATISGLTPGLTYYFAVTAVDFSGLESLFSNELTYKVPAEAPNPTIDPIPDVTVSQGTTWIQVPFTITGASSLLSSLVVTASSSNQDLVRDNKIWVSGSGTSWRVGIAPVPDQVGSTTIKLSASLLSVVSAGQFTFTVTSIPTVTLTSPSDGMRTLAPAAIDLTAAVAANGQTIDKVPVLQGGAPARRRHAGALRLYLDGSKRWNLQLERECRL